MRRFRFPLAVLGTSLLLVLGIGVVGYWTIGSAFAQGFGPFGGPFGGPFAGHGLPPEFQGMEQLPPAERFKHFKGVTVKKGARVGAGTVTLPGVVIGEDALVAAGSVVTGDVPARKIVLGTPARVWRDVPVEQLLENPGWVDS